MKEFIDVHVVLSTAEDFEQWDEEAAEASDKFNIIIHTLYNAVSEDIDTNVFEQMVQHVWETWSVDSQILQIEDNDFVCWVDEMLGGWDFSESQSDDEY